MRRMRLLLALSVSVAIGGSVLAADTSLTIGVDPPSIHLAGPDASYSLLVEQKLADGSATDLTRQAEFRSLTPGVVEVSSLGVVRGLSDGAGLVEVIAGGQKQSVAIAVEGVRRPKRFNFESDIVPLLSKFGCNSSGCHGKAEGQNGFKLSVFGFDPAADYAALAMEGRGRRMFPAVPEKSLFLEKAAGIVPHGGGLRIACDSREYAILRDWIVAGLPPGDPSDPHVVGLEVQPSERQLAMGAHQQLRAIAILSDGQRIDVTRVARFQSNNDGLAAVDDQGYVTAGISPGQVAVMASYMGAVSVFQALIPNAQPLADNTSWPEHNFIDPLVYSKLRKLNIEPAGLSSDAEYLRRVYLDVIGTLPTAEEAKRFLSDTRTDRRARLVDELLERNEFADYWALKWADLLRVDRTALGHKGAYSYYHWIHDRVADNTPLDRFAAEIITAEGPVSEVPQAQIFKVAAKPGDMASTISQVFLGVRIACAQCHHHPFDRWSQSDYYGMLDYFAPLGPKASPLGEVMLASGTPETRHPRTGELMVAHALGTAMPKQGPAGDRREELARWLTSPNNPWFARHQANRLWTHFLGRGLVEPIDDVRATNPPSNPALLDALAQYLIDQKFDQRQLIRAITASRVYQHASCVNDTNARDELNYSRALLKRMDAEVLLDAVCQVTGVGEKFQGVPAGYRAIQLWDSRASHYFLKLFGRPTRQSACECERNGEPSVGQVLHILNGPEISQKLSNPRGTIARLVAEMCDNGQLTDEIYLTFFSRYPSEPEKKLAGEYLQGSPSDRKSVAEDLAWSMLNSLEFVFNH
ncbi:MAG: DUF1553 domain-containing protein [Planctomycetia bacterium]|nr:DUF1553 domain-containing protein [Planctomycetia bacterium]